MNTASDDFIRLDQLLKLSGLAQTGGHAKVVIQNGEVRVNGEVETRRRRKLYPGDRVDYGDETVIVEDDGEPPQEVEL
ncbi:MAG TPA: RNA-binding S4 domain-containing protein [Planctomycetaceae bacterium]|nr:RNA-binding S4 domain-containing protein [Planctomycetaceae bacterium]